jgi:hypothetical protein
MYSVTGRVIGISMPQDRMVAKKTITPAACLLSFNRSVSRRQSGQRISLGTVHPHQCDDDSESGWEE